MLICTPFFMFTYILSRYRIILKIYTANFPIFVSSTTDRSFIDYSNTNFTIYDYISHKNDVEYVKCDQIK